MQDNTHIEYNDVDDVDEFSDKGDLLNIDIKTVI